jgi:hypothetical protein
MQEGYVRTSDEGVVVGGHEADAQFLSERL